MTSDLHQRLDGTPSGSVDRLAAAVSSGALPAALKHVPEAARAHVRDAAQASFVSALNELFWIGAAVAVVGALLSALLIRQHEVGLQDG